MQLILVLKKLKVRILFFITYNYKNMLWIFMCWLLIIISVNIIILFADGWSTGASEVVQCSDWHCYVGIRYLIKFHFSNYCNFFLNSRPSPVLFYCNNLYWRITDILCLLALPFQYAFLAGRRWPMIFNWSLMTH